MNVRQVLKRSDTIVGLVRDLKKISRLVRQARRNARIKNYLAVRKVRKLHIGAGTTAIDGWLTTDYEPKSDHVLFLDATKPFPFEDNTFDYVYSEHMIEHISWKEGLLMLKECRRVLKPGGMIRIATPDLAIIIGLYSRREDPLRERYIKEVTDRFIAVDAYKPSFVINNAFRNWGHQFLYDGELMEMAMQFAGFNDIRRFRLGESNDENLRGIERHGSVINEMTNRYETMVYEATSPV